MRSFYFWQRWLFYSSILFALVGILFAVWGDGPIFKIYYKALAAIFWNRDSFPVETEPFRLFICGPVGATIACCYILLAYIAWFPFAKKEPWSRNAIIFGFGIWAIIDSGVCLYYDVCFQV